jgi:aldehyde dehydrogenase (NAD+)
MNQFSVPQGVRTLKMFVGGKWVEASSGEWIESECPFTRQVWAKVPAGTADDIDRAVRAADAAFPSWSQSMGSERARLLRRLGALLTENAQQLAVSEVMDNGKLISEMLGQAQSFEAWCNYFAGVADKIHGETIPVDVPDMISFTVREPLGVVGAIIPWNSPLMLTMWKICPALAAGNTIVIKPSEIAPVSLLELARLVELAGFPAGVFNVVTGYGRDAGDALSRHPLVRKVAFTGSTATGRTIVRNSAENFAHVSLELGGKSPNIIFKDADLENATNGVLQGIFAASGQTCMAGSRVLVQRAVYDQVIEILSEKAKAIRVGDPLDMASQMGTVAFEGQYKKVLDYVGIGVREGAELVSGGRHAHVVEYPDGFFVEPTVFGNVRNDMRIAREEIFGPVASVLPFEDDEEAVAIANDTEFGLAAAVWTLDVQRAHRLTRRIQAGTVWVNNYRKISYAAPFGGFKSSGYGRENGLDSLLEYTQLKTVWIDLGNKITNPFKLM